MRNDSFTELKRKYIEYFKDVPVQKYAAMAIARDEDTIIRWKKNDKQFADAVQRAKAEWIRKKVIATKAEYALDRIEKSFFSSAISESTINTYSETKEKLKAFLNDTNDI